MEAQEEAIAITKEQSMILKGKRTKRQRPQSPIPFTIAPPISSHGVEEESTSLDDSNYKSIKANEEEEEEDTNINKGNGSNVLNGVCYAQGGVTISSTSSSSNNNNGNNDALNATDEEDQDMAHCLILLAQGHSLSHHHNQQRQQQQMMIRYHETSNNNDNNNNNGFRFSSRRFLETSTSNGTNGGGGKAGYYVYQCKTCDRTFPSFQALGGHRASHKKPKALRTDVDLKKPVYSDTVSLHLNTVTNTCNNNNQNHNQRGLVMYSSTKVVSNKVHECGICGAEFTSGQALGGHMRRHRGAVVAVAAAATTANTALSLSPMSFDQSDGQDYPAKKPRNSVVSLDLDLNLPAPEDENRINGLGFASKQEHETEHAQQKQREEQKSLVLSAPTLVDCHY